MYPLAVLALIACDGAPLLSGLPHASDWQDDPDPSYSCPISPDCLKQFGCVAISGRSLDDAGVCSEKATVGCRAKKTSCDEALTYAKAWDGRLWQFPTRCTPNGWPVVEFEAGAPEAWSRCAELDRAAQR